MDYLTITDADTDAALDSTGPAGAPADPRKTTLVDLGYQLAAGVDAGAGQPRERGFAFAPWRSKDERILGSLRDRNRAMTPGVFASEVLGHFLTLWGAQDLRDMSAPQRRLLLSRAYAGDVYTAWFQLRREVLGDDFDMEITCLCRHAFPYAVDLGTVEVKVVLDGDTLAQPFALRDGVEYRGTTSHVATIKPLRWDVYEGLGPSTGMNMGAVKSRFAAGAIVGLSGLDVPGEVHLPADALDLSKRDLEGLAAAIDKMQPGPDLSVDVDCPQCGTRCLRALPWTYDSFFSVRASSPGGPPTA